MKIAVLSDIHSNYIALQACFDEIEKLDVFAVIYLGDYFTDCPYPQKTLEIIDYYKKRYDCYFVRGNREEYLLSYDDSNDKDWQYSSHSGSLLYTYENLTREQLGLFRVLPITDVVKFDEYDDITICHGSVNVSREALNPDEENTKACLDNINTKYLLCGHSHKQFEYRHNGKVVINPGTVGMQCNGQVNAQFAILSWESDEWICEHKNIPYDIKQLMLDFHISGMVEKAKVWAKGVLLNIQTGHNYVLDCVILANELYKKSDEYIENATVPEKFWEQAYDILTSKLDIDIIN